MRRLEGIAGLHSVCSVSAHACALATEKPAIHVDVRDVDVRKGMTSLVPQAIQNERVVSLAHALAPCLCFGGLSTCRTLFGSLSAGIRAGTLNMFLRNSQNPCSSRIQPQLPPPLVPDLPPQTL
jgi:hypothetical protein